MSSNDLLRHGSAKAISSPAKDHKTELNAKREIPKAISKDLFSKVPIKGSANSLYSQPSSSWNLFRIFQKDGNSSSPTDGSSRTHSTLSLSKASSNSRSSIYSGGMSRTSLTSPTGRLSIKAFSISKTTQRLSLGKVMIGNRKNEKQMVEIKRYTKELVVNAKKVYALLQERFIMEQLRSEHYVTTLRYAFQDECYAYLVYDLDDFPFTMAIPDSCIVREAVLKNLAAQLSYALKYLHENYIIFNGLKLDTLFVKNGNVLLKDFSNSIYTKKEKPTVSFKLQMPVPELLDGDPGWYSIDWWCLGTLLFHLSFGKPLIPAGSNLAEVKSIFKAFKLRLPQSHLAGIELNARSDRNDFINDLLVTEPLKRLGSGAGGLGFEKDVKSHKWMTSIEWEDVRAQKLQLKLDYTKMSKKTRRESVGESTADPPGIESNIYETSPTYAQKMEERMQENFLPFSIDFISSPMAYITKDYLREKSP